MNIGINEIEGSEWIGEGVQIKYRGENRTIRIYYDPNCPFYEVDMDKAKTKRGLVDWIFHLHEKTWCTPDIIYGFLVCVRFHCSATYNKSVYDYYDFGGGE